MDIQLIHNGCNSLSYSDRIPDSLSSYGIPGAVPKVEHCTSGYFLLQEMEGDGFTIRHHTYLLEKEDRVAGRCSRPTLILRIALSNNFYYQSEGLGNWEMHEGSFNILYLPHPNLMILRPGRTYAHFEIHYSFEYLSELAERIAGPYPALREFLRKSGGTENVFLSPVNRLATAGMMAVVREILACVDEGPMLMLFLDTKVMELLILALKKLDQVPSRRKAYFRKEETEKLYMARDLVLGKIYTPWTLHKLARRVGLNTNKLKTGFQELFGCSVFHILLQVRMEKAAGLLTETESGLEETALETGYTSAKSLSKAFKKYSGRAPGDYRRFARSQNE